MIYLQTYWKNTTYKIKVIKVKMCKETSNKVKEDGIWYNFNVTGEQVYEMEFVKNTIDSITYNGLITPDTEAKE